MVQKIPEKFLAKILQRLSKAGLLRSIRGSNGGFSLRKPAGKITMLEVIEALEGPVAINRCLLRKGECAEDQVCGSLRRLGRGTAEFAQGVRSNDDRGFGKANFQ